MHDPSPNPTLRHAKRVAIAILGGTVIAIGILLIVLPGPAFVVIPAGLAILAIEFEWSRRWLAKIRSFIEQGKSRITGERPLPTEPTPGPTGDR